MRLTPEQTRWITRTVDRLSGAEAEVYLFGSRLDDSARGGDVDLLIETDVPLPLLQRARIKMELEALLGLPVDVVARARNMPPSPFQRLVRAQARKLEVQS